MGLLGALALLFIGALLGYGYFRLRSKPTPSLIDDYLADQDYIDCSASTTSKTEVVACYIDKKSAKLKKELDMN